MEIDARNMAIPLDHDEEAEQIVMALGGQPPTCMIVVRAFTNPVALTPPNDPRFVAYCTDPRFVSERGMEQVASLIRYGLRPTSPQRYADLKRTLLEASPSLRMRWLVRWLDVVTALPEGHVLHASAEFVAYRIAGASGGVQPAIPDLQRIVLEGWERGTNGLPDWSALSPA